MHFCLIFKYSLKRYTNISVYFGLYFSGTHRVIRQNSFLFACSLLNNILRKERTVLLCLFFLCLLFFFLFFFLLCGIMYLNLMLHKCFALYVI